MDTSKEWVAWQLAPESDLGRRHILTTRDGSEEISGIFYDARDAKLAAAAVNSYARHCADPLAAAEADLLGEALAALETASNALELAADELDTYAGESRWLRGHAKGCRAVLAKAGRVPQ